MNIQKEIEIAVHRPFAAAEEGTRELFQGIIVYLKQRNVDSLDMLLGSMSLAYDIGIMRGKQEERAKKGVNYDEK